MSKSDLLRMLESTSLFDLKSMIITKEKLDKLLQKKSAIEKNLSSIDKQIESIMRPLENPGSKPPAVKKIPATRIKRAGQGKRTFQPSIQSLTAAILQEKKKPLSVNEIADCLLNGKKYKTTSVNFKNQLRVLLYRNKKGLFKKVGSGEFALAGEKVPVSEKVEVKKKPVINKEVAKKIETKNKFVQKKKSSAEKKAVPTPISAKKSSPQKKLAQPSIQSLLADILRGKKKAMTIQELTDALLKEKKYQTAAKDFKGNVALILYENKKGLFKRVEAGKFGLA